MRKIIRIFLILVAIALLYFVLGHAKDLAIDWYVDNHIPRPTEFPATEAPDQLVLTWSDDPRTSMAVQWRTNSSVQEGYVQFRPASAPEGDAVEVSARRETIEDAMVHNDLGNQRFSAVLEGLEPDTAYLYRAGSKDPEQWSAWRPFTTAPAEETPFSFMYMGDVQNGYDFWGGMMQQAHGAHPEAAFYLIAGDLVNNGDYRDHWDAFFAAGAGVFDQRPLVPVLGNHDYDKKLAPTKYLQLFTLPENGPANVGVERAFSLTYANALFVVLDSNRSLRAQTPWLEKQLASSTARWKFVSYHHPAYVSRAVRENPYVRDTWGPIFEEHGVDIVFQGHDHAYLRTYPIRNGKRAAEGERGVIYLVSVAGNKYYEQDPSDYTEVGFADVSTYQIIDITTAPHQLHYRAFDETGVLKDEFTLTKE